MKQLVLPYGADVDQQMLDDLGHMDIIKMVKTQLNKAHLQCNIEGDTYIPEGMP